jgi:signal transduction histidine kinase
MCRQLCRVYGGSMNRYERLESRVTRVARPVVVDSLVFALFGVVSIITTFQQEVVPGLHEPHLIDGLLALLVAGPILFRRRVPLAALITSCVFTIILVGTHAPEGIVAFTIAFMTYSAAARSPMRTAILGIGSVVVTLLVLGATNSPGLAASDVARFSAIYAVVWAGGVAVRARQQAIEASLREATERAEVSAERSARAVAEERLRIAQELHDVVAHSISIVAVQAGVGSHFIDTDTEETRAALDAIGRTSRSTLDELRRLLGVLRGDDGSRRHLPAPTLADLPDLIGEMRSVGLPVTLEVHGRREGDHRAIEMSAYRIVQEALTNVIKHAGTTTAVTVAIDHHPDALAVRIADDGRGNGVAIDSAAVPSGRHGLIGMRERVDVWGGEISSGPQPGGGYAVAATFPYGSTP